MIKEESVKPLFSQAEIDMFPGALEAINEIFIHFREIYNLEEFFRIPPVFGEAFDLITALQGKSD
jgi:hypothetical protein